MILGVRALVVKGLSRLPVTEEIAGSNPVERATETTSPLVGYFLFTQHPPVLSFI